MDSIFVRLNLNKVKYVQPVANKIFLHRDENDQIVKVEIFSPIDIEDNKENSIFYESRN